MGRGSGSISEVFMCRQGFTLKLTTWTMFRFNFYISYFVDLKKRNVFFLFSMKTEARVASLGEPASAWAGRLKLSGATGGWTASLLQNVFEHSTPRSGLMYFSPSMSLRWAKRLNRHISTVRDQWGPFRDASGSPEVTAAQVHDPRSWLSSRKMTIFKWYLGLDTDW